MAVVCEGQENGKVPAERAQKFWGGGVPKKFGQQQKRAPRRERGKERVHP